MRHLQSFFSPAELQILHDVEFLNGVDADVLVKKNTPSSNSPQKGLMLDFSNAQLTKLPESLPKIFSERFIGLDISNNHIQDLPRTFEDVSFSIALNWADNQLSSLPPSFRKFPFRHYLNLNGNYLQKFPSIPLNKFNFLGLNLEELMEFPDLRDAKQLHDLEANGKNYIPLHTPLVETLKITDLMKSPITAWEKMQLFTKHFEFFKGSKTPLLEVLSQLSRFNCLVLSIEQTTLDSIPPAVFENGSINELNLRNNRFTKCESFPYLPSVVDLSYNPLNHVPTQEEIGPFYDRVAYNIGKFQGLHLRQIPEDTCFNVLDLSSNEITVLANDDRINPLISVNLDHNPLHTIESLDFMALCPEISEFIGDWAGNISVQNCNLTEIPPIFATKHFNRLYLDSNPWIDHDRIILEKLGLLSPHFSYNFSTNSIKRQIMQIFDEYLLSKGNYISRITEKIHRNDPLTIMDRIHPQLNQNFEYLMTECKNHPTPTGQQLEKIILQEMSISASQSGYQKLFL